MRYRIQVSKRAAQQIREAAAWWIENRDKSPGALAEEIEQAVDLLGILPAAGQRVAHSRLKEVRRLDLGRVHYYLYYQVDRSDETVEILGLWHSRRGRSPDL